MITET